MRKKKLGSRIGIALLIIILLIDSLLVQAKLISAQVSSENPLDLTPEEIELAKKLRAKAIIIGVITFPAASGLRAIPSKAAAAARPCPKPPPKAAIPIPSPAPRARAAFTKKSLPSPAIACPSSAKAVTE